MSRYKTASIFQPGDFYRDCNGHVVLCTEVEADGDGVAGVSLYDGSQPRSCSIRHCAVDKLTWKQVLRLLDLTPTRDANGFVGYVDNGAMV